MRYVLMALGWWAGAIVLSVVIVKAKVNGGCPKVSIKCWIGSLLSIAYGFGYYYFMGLKGGFMSQDYLVSFIVASFFGAAVARILCPLPPE
jgi:hypothetical protein